MNQLSDEQLDQVSGGVRAAAYFRAARRSDQLSQLNTKMDTSLTEANDAEARMTSMLNDYKGLLAELRQG